MSRYADHLRADRAKRKGRRKFVVRRAPAVYLDSSHQGLLFRTRCHDWVAIYHRFSGRVISTHALPARIIDDLWPEALREMCMSFLSKPTKAQGTVPHGVSLPADCQQKWPALGEYLFHEVYPDGSKRQRATVTIMAGDSSGWKVVLNDRQEARSLWATGVDLDETLEALDAMLRSEDPPWRVDRKWTGANGKK